MAGTPQRLRMVIASHDFRERRLPWTTVGRFCFNRTTRSLCSWPVDAGPGPLTSAHVPSGSCSSPAAGSASRTLDIGRMGAMVPVFVTSPHRWTSGRAYICDQYVILRGGWASFFPGRAIPLWSGRRPPCRRQDRLHHLTIRRMRLVQERRDGAHLDA